MKRAVRRELRGARAFRTLAKAFRLRGLSHANSWVRINELMSAAESAFWRNAKTNARNARAPRSYSAPCLN